MKTITENAKLNSVKKNLKEPISQPMPNPDITDDWAKVAIDIRDAPDELFYELASDSSREAKSLVTSQ